MSPLQSVEPMGRTVDFRKFAQRGMTLLGMTQRFENGRLTIAGTLRTILPRGTPIILGCWLKLTPMLRPTVLIYLRRRRRKSLHQTQTA